MKYSNSSVFNAQAQAIVNTVNCVGVMGAGLALECKLRYPEMYIEYHRLCKNAQMKVGSLHFYRAQKLPHIINFPTKRHWKYPSQLDWIEEGLQYFLDNYKDWDIQSVAFPKLGCDLGGLNWLEVSALMEQYFSKVQDITITICTDSASQSAGIELKMLQIIDNPILWQDLITPSYVDKILKNTPVERFRKLQKIFKSDQYKYLFDFFYNLALAHSKNSALSPKESRLALVKLLTRLELSPLQMSELTWNDFVYENGYYWLNFPPNQSINISTSLWQELELLKVNQAQDTPVLHSLKGGHRKLHISTIKKLISYLK